MKRKKKRPALWEVFGHGHGNIEMRLYLEAEDELDAEAQATEQGMLWVQWARNTEEK